MQFFLHLCEMFSSFLCGFAVVKNENQNDSPTVQKIITSKRQLLANNTPKVVRTTTSNLQQLLNQGGQKFVINQSNTPNKLIISSSSNSQVANQDTTVVAQQQQQQQSQTIVQNSTAQLIQSPQQTLVVSQPTQKVIQSQEYVNPTNQQQQIIFHGQRFVLNPGQRIQVTQQQQPTQVVQQIVQQPQVVQQVQQIQQVKFSLVGETGAKFKTNLMQIMCYLFLDAATVGASCTTNITATTNNHTTFTSANQSGPARATVTGSTIKCAATDCCGQFTWTDAITRQSSSCNTDRWSTSNHSVCNGKIERDEVTFGRFSL